MGAPLSEALRFDITAQDKASRAFAQLADKVEDVADELKKLDKTKAEPKVDVDTAAAEKKIEKFAANLRKKVEAAAKNLPSIDITADSSDADREIAQVRKDLLALGDKEIKTEIDAAQAEAKIRELSAKLTRLNSESVDIKVKADTLSAVQALGKVKLDSFKLDVDTKAAEAKLGKFATEARRDIEKALKALPDIQIDADSTPAQQEVGRLRAELAELADLQIGVDIDAVDAIGRARAIKEQLDEIQRRTPANIQINADAAAAAAALAAIVGEVEQLDGKTANVKVDVDKSLSDSIVQVAALGRALSQLALPAAAIAAAPQIAAIGAAALTASGALLLIPAAGVAAGAAVGTLALGFKGFGDAVGDNPTKAAEAMAKLSPEARQAAQAVSQLAPAWRAVQQSVQDNLFAGIAEDLKSMSGTYLPAVQRTLGGVASGFNSAAQATEKFLTAPATVQKLSAALFSTEVATKNASGALQPFAAAMTDIVTTGAARLPALGTALADVAAEFAGFISRAEASGQLGEWIDNGITALKTLGSIAGNVAASLGSIFKAAQSSGADFLGTLDGITQKIRDFLASGEGQSALVTVFTSIREAVDAATPGVEALVRAITSVVQSLGDASVLQAAASAFSALAQNIAPLVEMAGGLAPVLSGLLGVIQSLAPALVPAATAVAGFWLAMKVMDGIDGIRSKVGGFASEVRNLGTSMSGGGLKGAITGLATSLGAGGVLGLALGGAGLALGLLATQQADAKQAAADHKAKVDELAGSIDILTGKLNDQGRAQIASDIAGRKLSDGTTSYATAMAQAGINLQDFTDAATGNGPALEKVNGQLHDGARAALENSTEWNNNRSTYNAAGVSLDLLSDAALGNVQAQEEVQRKLDATGKGWRNWQGGVQDAIGPLAEMGATLGAFAGTVAEAGTQAQTQAAAIRDFGAALDTIKPGLAGLKDGAAPLPLMVEGFKGLASSAQTAAQRAAELAKETGGVAAGAQAATSSMQQSRDAFISAATGAGLSAEQAAKLADQIGLIPAAAATNFTSNAAGVAAEMNTLAAQVAAVPGAKQITVDTLSEGAQQKLRDLGFTVTTLPNGQVQVDVHDEAGRAKLMAFLATANSQVGLMKLDADATAATGKTTNTVTFMNGQTGTVTLDANGAPATAVLNGTKYNIDTTTGIMTIDGNPAPGEQDRSGLKVAIDRTTGTLTIEGRDGGVQALKDRLSQPSSSTHTIYVREAVTRVVTTGPNDPRNVPGRATPAGGGVFGYAGGGVHGFAGGGIRANRRRGMVVPGYAPGKDTVPALISKGESVLVPELTRMLGARRILAANAEASGGRPATMVGQLAGIMDGTLRSTVSGMTHTRRGPATPGTVRSATTTRSSATLISAAMNDATRQHSGSAGTAAAIAAAIGRQTATLSAKLTQLGDRLGNVERSVNISNSFSVPDSTRLADEVSRRQRTQAALGLFG